MVDGGEWLADGFRLWLGLMIVSPSTGCHKACWPHWPPDGPPRQRQGRQGGIALTTAHSPVLVAHNTHGRYMRCWRGCPVATRVWSCWPPTLDVTHFHRHLGSTVSPEISSISWGVGCEEDASGARGVAGGDGHLASQGGEKRRLEGKWKYANSKRLDTANVLVLTSGSPGA